MTEVKELETIKMDENLSLAVDDILEAVDDKISKNIKQAEALYMLRGLLKDEKFKEFFGARYNLKIMELQGERTVFTLGTSDTTLISWMIGVEREDDGVTPTGITIREVILDGVEQTEKKDS